jgi:hypothetical protein
VSTIATSLPRARAASSVEDDRSRVTPALHRQIGFGALRPDLQLLFGGGAPGIGGAEQHRPPVLAELLRELSDRGRLAGAVDADDENHARRRGQVERAGLAEHVGDLLRERSTEVAELVACLEPADELGGGADAHIALDQGLLEPLPVLVVSGIEGRSGELAGEGAPAFAERVTEPSEEALLLLGGLRRAFRITQEL